MCRFHNKQVGLGVAHYLFCTLLVPWQDCAALERHIRPLLSLPLSLRVNKLPKGACIDFRINK